MFTSLYQKIICDNILVFVTLLFHYSNNFSSCNNNGNVSTVKKVLPTKILILEKL